MNRLLSVACAAALLCACATSPSGGPIQPREAPQAGATAPRSGGGGARLPVESVRFATKLSFDRDGKLTRTVDERYVVVSASPEGYFGHSEVEYDPLQADRPELTATVTLPDGSARHLDPATIVETPARPSGPRNLADRRRVIAPLPGLVPGSVVERRSVVVTSRPIATFGQAWSAGWAFSIPQEEASIVVEYPRDLPITIVPVGIEQAPLREEAEGFVRLTWKQSAVPAWDESRHGPPEANEVPRVHVSTARSWQDVARGYFHLIESKIDPAALSTIATQIRSEATKPEEVVAAALSWMHHNLRYTGLDLANGGIVPHAASDTLQRGYGDCKDLAALLVSLLQAAGIEARIALVNASGLADAPQEIAGIGRFDHAIVYVPGPRPLWIDPTLRGLPPGSLSDTTGNKLALVIDPRTTAPIRTPIGDADQNRVTIHTEITLPEFGPAKVRMERVQTGIALSWYRDWAIEDTRGDGGGKQAEEIQRRFGTETYRYTQTDPLDVRSPFRQIFDIEDSAEAHAWDASATAPLGFGAVHGLFPWYLIEGDDEDEPEPVDAFVGAPARLEMVTRIRVPALFRLRTDHVRLSEEVGGFRWSLSIQETQEGVEARLDVRIDSRTIPSGDVIAVRQSLARLRAASDTLQFDNKVFHHLDAGQIVQAEAELRAIEAVSTSPWLKALRARIALRAGLGPEARRLAREAARLAPDAPHVLRTLGVVLAHDPFGRLYGRGMEREEAIRAFERVLKVAPGDGWSHAYLIDLLARNGNGIVAGQGADRGRALEELRAYRKRGETDLDSLYHSLLWAEGQDDELIEGASRGVPEGLVLAAVARRDGLEAALSRHRRGRQDGAVTVATFELLKARAYRLAHGLSREDKDPRVATLTHLLERTRRREETPFDPNHPRDIVIESTAWAVGGATRVPIESLGLTQARRESLHSSLAPVIEKFEPGPEVLLDFIHAMLELTEQEIPGIGVLVESQSPFLAGAWELLVRTPNGLALHPMDPDERAEQAWLAWEKGNGDLARAWLDVLLKTSHQGQNPLEPMVRSWMSGSHDDLGVAIALARPSVPRFARARTEALGRGLAVPRSNQTQTLLLGGFYILALIDEGRFDDALAVVDDLLARGMYPDEASSWGDRARILTAAGRIDELEAWALALLQQHPRLEQPYVLVGSVARLRKDHVLYRDTFVAMAHAGFRREMALNNAAWASLFLGVGDEDVRRAELALGTRGENVSALDTLAVLLVERGEIDRALAIADKILDRTGKPAHSSHYMKGRMAEALGFHEAAIESYQAVEAVADGMNDLRGLAQQRLAGLKAPGSSKAKPAAATR